MLGVLQKADALLIPLDILLVATVLYQLLRLLRESTAVRILIVMPLVIVTCLAARLTGLAALSWVFDKFIISMFLILVVVFQYDIRRALLSISRVRVSGEGVADSFHEDTSPLLDQLADAALSLAERRNGALIVIEREMSLEHLLEVGTEIDAKVTSELIASIFLPYSPIHDGAVIIRHGKLTQAGCFLPLTQNPDIAKELGTRHRAAIGLTEVADALVIVISEETGSISVVSGGHITRDLDAAQLRKLLRRMVEPRWLQ
jgi:uncharacterized protein (TIGR00159 family)